MMMMMMMREEDLYYPTTSEALSSLHEGDAGVGKCRMRKKKEVDGVKRLFQYFWFLQNSTC
jgi:hypothetical protein